MEEKKLVNIVPLEKDGWYLTRQIHNKKGLAAIETRPLSSVAIETPGDPICNTVTVDRVKDDDGKYVCSACGKKLGNTKPKYCPNCGGLFGDSEE